MELGESHPGQGVHLQGYSQQPGGPANTLLVQNSYTNRVVDPPKDHIMWSICCFAYLNPLCLGLTALIFSIKARDRVMVGDLEGGRHYGATARCLNIVSTVLFCLIIAVTVIVIIVIVAQANAAVRSINRYGFRY